MKTQILTRTQSDQSVDSFVKTLIGYWELLPCDIEKLKTDTYDQYLRKPHTLVQRIKLFFTN